MSDIAEKWGITPLVSHRFYVDVHAKTSEPYCRTDEVREIEQQNLRLLDELMKSTIALEEKFFIAQMEESMLGIFPFMPFLAGSSQKPEKGSPADLIEKACYRNIELIQEIDPQHRTYGELKELYNG